ncbi:hypothetical protein LTR12_012258 [Friedmanniomyces endolithicus]|nr:hypothetical protein LTR74_008436 [Friedmanniomyces endolithicus]KAK1813334.1 hypothetical protein LTR12_012258 [Friedmanniomyces endolithicus]
MASRVIIDFKSLGEQIVTAMQTSIGNISQAHVAHAAKQVKQEERPLGIREQILDNARVLWPIIDAKRKDRFGAPMRPRPIPEMQIVVFGRATTIQAWVVRSEYGQYDKRIYSQRYHVFLCSNYTDTVDKAQQQLLEITMDMLNEAVLTNMYATGSQVVVKGQRAYYVPGEATE